jgi:hypothetical protein
VNQPSSEPRPPPANPSHLWPRTRAGRAATIAFLVLTSLAQWPFVFRFANRVEPWVLGVPFLYAYLFFVYVALIGVLLWVWKRKL